MKLLQQLLEQNDALIDLETQLALRRAFDITQEKAEAVLACIRGDADDEQETSALNVLFSHFGYKFGDVQQAMIKGLLIYWTKRLLKNEYGIEKV